MKGTIDPGDDGFEGQGARGTCRGAMTAGDTNGHVEGLVVVWPYREDVVRFVEGQGRRAFHLPAYLEAQAAKDAFPRVADDKGMVLVDGKGPRRRRLIELDAIFTGKSSEDAGVALRAAAGKAPRGLPHRALVVPCVRRFLKVCLSDLCRKGGDIESFRRGHPPVLLPGYHPPVSLRAVVRLRHRCVFPRAEVFVYLQGRTLPGAYGVDGDVGAAHAVSPGEDTGDGGFRRVRVRQDGAVLRREVITGDALVVHDLSDGADDGGTDKVELGAFHGHRPAPAAPVGLTEFHLHALQGQ